jgi:hypothetical protein
MINLVWRLKGLLGVFALLACHLWLALFASHVPQGEACRKISWTCPPTTPKSCMQFDPVTHGISLDDTSRGEHHNNLQWNDVGSLVYIVLRGGGVNEGKSGAAWTDRPLGSASICTHAALLVTETSKARQVVSARLTKLINVPHIGVLFVTGVGMFGPPRGA